MSLGRFNHSDCTYNDGKEFHLDKAGTKMTATIAVAAVGFYCRVSGLRRLYSSRSESDTEAAPNSHGEMSESGTDRTTNDVRSSVATGGKADMPGKAYFGRD
jgi:hypothetical protein